MRDLLPPVRFHYKLDDPTTTTTTLPFPAQNLPPLRQIPNSRFRLQSPISHTYVHIIRTYNTTFFLDKSSRNDERLNRRIGENEKGEEEGERTVVPCYLGLIGDTKRERESGKMDVRRRFFRGRMAVVGGPTTHTAIQRRVSQSRSGVCGRRVLPWLE